MIAQVGSPCWKTKVHPAGIHIWNSIKASAYTQLESWNVKKKRGGGDKNVSRISGAKKHWRSSRKDHSLAMFLVPVQWSNFQKMSGKNCLWKSLGSVSFSSPLTLKWRWKEDFWRVEQELPIKEWYDNQSYNWGKKQAFMNVQIVLGRQSYFWGSLT